jgi:aminopeptidase N
MLRDWTAAHRHGSVTTELFIQHVEGYSQAPVRPLLESWLFQGSLPALPKRR